MTGKIQKVKNDTKDFLKRVEISQEEKAKLIDDVIIEVHSENSDFIEGVAKLPIKTFRGMYILHTLYSMIDKKVDEKVQELLSQKISKYQEEEALKKRK